MAKGKYSDRDRDIYLQYRALRKEGFSRPLSLRVLAQSDYGYLGRKTLKRICNSVQKAEKKKKNPKNSPES